MTEKFIFIFLQGDESVDIEQVTEEGSEVNMEFGIVPSEIIASSEDSSDDSDDMTEDERRIFDLINLKVS